MSAVGLPLALTLGEPAGIGPDLTLQIWKRRRELDLPAFYLIGDVDFLAKRARALGLDVPLAAVTPAQAEETFARALPVVPLGRAVTAAPGEPDASSAPAAIASIRRAVDDVLAGRAGAVVTNPVAKNVLYRSGFVEPGHTEFLARLAQEATGKFVKPVMMLWSPELAVVPVTIHLPLHDVVAQLTQELIVETGRIVARDLAVRFHIARPRLAVAGLNPHAGEDGALGLEDAAIVAPAVKQLQAEGIDAVGPISADTVFQKAWNGAFDLVVAQYHDQSHIPMKLVAFDTTVNVSLGLPIDRTSVDHGTAFDIAGTGRANHANMLAAIAHARKLADTPRAAS